MSEDNAQEDLSSRLAQLERENRKLRREVTHLNQALVQEKLASTTSLNQYKASTFLQRERERYLTLLLANSPSIILFLNLNGRIEFCTDYFLAHAGFINASEVQGQVASEILARFLDADTHKTLLEHIDNALSWSTPQAFDARFSFQDNGLTKDFAGLLIPMQDAEEQNKGMLLLFHDVTDLMRSREEALTASKAKSLFLSNMSHEIRTPMNAIIGMTSIGQKETSIERKDYSLQKIETASIHLLGIINDILDISKIESGKMELSPIAFSFRQMLDGVVTISMQKIQEKRQLFSVTIDPDIPEIVVGDNQHLAQVIANILSNATKFTPEEGTIDFTATLLRRNDESCVIQMSVKDSGIGMSRQEQSKLFTIFQQAQADTARKYGGSGLGLAISKRILELMCGDIWVESAPGAGTCFFFTATLGFPHAVQIPTPDIPEKPKSAERTGGEPGEGTDTPFAGRHILIVDDVAINLEIVTTLLEDTGLAMDTANNGREAVAVFAAYPDRYDLILMDVQMPEVDGLQATAEIRKMGLPRSATIPIVAMTANVFQEDIRRCLEAGMDAHLGKPIVLDEVLAVLTRYLA